MTNRFLPISLEEGKYTILFDDKGFRALRHGGAWCDLNGDKMVLALCHHIDELEANIKGLEELCDDNGGYS